MWFVLLGIALAVVAAGGLYFRHRVLDALETAGVSRKPRRIVGIAIPWLLFGYPVLVFVAVAISVALGRESQSIAPAGVAEWLLVFPFWFAVMVMLQTLPFLLLIDLATLVGRKRLPAHSVSRLRSIACLGIIAVFSVYTPARILLERGDLEVLHYDVGADSGEPLRIAFLADLQLDHHTDEARANEVVDLVNQQRPDLILSGGDWINIGPDYIEAAGRVAGRLKSPLGVFSVRGDHEHFAYRDQERSVDSVTRALDEHGVPILHNQVRIVNHRGRRVAIAFLSYNYIYRTPPDGIRSLLAKVQDADYSILVTHQFDGALAELVRDQVDLALIAHTHGGQVNPVVGFVHVPLARVETPYIAGRYQLGSTTLIVTSGVGYSIAPFRYASPASIEVIDLRLPR